MSGQADTSGPELAGKLDDGMRAICHLTRDPDALSHGASDIYLLIGHFSSTVTSMTQTIGQLDSALAAQLVDETIRLNDATDPTATVLAVTAALEHAQAAARQLHEALDTAHEALTGASTRPSPSASPPQQPWGRAAGRSTVTTGQVTYERGWKPPAVTIRVSPLRPLACRCSVIPKGRPSPISSTNPAVSTTARVWADWPRISQDKSAHGSDNEQSQVR